MLKAAIFNRPFLVAAALIFAAALAMNTAVAYLGLYLQKLPIQPPDDRQAASVPAETESWRRLGTDILMSEEMIETLETRNYLSRYYEKKQTADGKPLRVELHLAYYTGMIDTVPHVPERCMVGGGFLLAGPSVVLPLKLDQSDWFSHPAPAEGPAGGQGGRRGVLHRIRHNNDDRYTTFAGQYVTLPRDIESATFRISQFKGPNDASMFAGYFFIANGGWCSSAYDIRELAFRLTDTYAYYMKVQVSSSDVRTPEELREAASSLIGELLPEIMRCVPDWNEVEKGSYPPDNQGRESPTGISGRRLVPPQKVQTTPEKTDSRKFA